MTDTVRVRIRRPDDWHLHLRDDQMLGLVVGYSARRFRYCMVMPNLVPPVTAVAQARAYRDRILTAAGPVAVESGFSPLMTLYLTAAVTADDLTRGVEEGVIAAVKYYPRGATTNSADGGGSLAEFADLLDHMVTLGLPLLVHAESTDPEVDIFDRERDFLERELAPTIGRHPELRITVEHVSTRAGVDLVVDHERLVATITPHHLSCDRTDLLANGLRPHLYCKPVVNSPDDRAALATAATSGNPRFFLGTDSAPHPLSEKEAAVAKPGIFNAPTALEVVADQFHGAGRLDALEGFVSLHGAAHYGFDPAEDYLALQLQPGRGTELPEVVGDRNQPRVRIFGRHEATRWTVTPDRSLP